MSDVQESPRRGSARGNPSQAESPMERFQALLRELFQFDCADLDFGIYRIMNHKRDAVERFITTKLPETIAAELGTGTLARQAQTNAALEKARGQVEKTLGPDAIMPDGDILPALAQTLVAQDYLDARARAAGTRSREALEADTYNHLYTFFGRYYQDGDFVSKRRHSGNHRYAIPYNGEEVYLHWANSDQYYIKTAEHFHSYRWRSPSGVSVHFLVDSADVERNNVKGERRFFVPRTVDATLDAAARTLTLPFSYRPLSATEQASYGRSNQQDKIIAAALEELPKRFKEPDAIAAITAQRRRSTDNEPITHFEHHLFQYTRRNDSDFFIHKDLRGFLSRELDFYLKNEVLNLDNMSAAGEHAAEGWFQLLRLIKSGGDQIIDFLAQIEGFQKMLWEKRKFVIETNYCIKLAEVDRAFYDEIVANESQWVEWEQLFGIRAKNRSAGLLEANPALPLDTRHFDFDFSDRLLGTFDDLDAKIDGLLIQGENWQALSLLRERFRNAIRCLYIDPPYNTGDSEILYKNGYMHSSWLTMMENRLAVAMPVLAADPTCYIAIDDCEMVDLCELIDRHFGTWRREMVVVNHHPQGGKGSTLSTTHEYMLTCVGRDARRALVGRASDQAVERRPFKRSGTAESNFRHARPNSFYAILVDRETRAVVGLEPPPPRDDLSYPTTETADGYTRIYPLGTNGQERVWRRSFESCSSLVRDGQLECSESGTVYQLVGVGDKTPALFSNWTGSRYNAGTHGANLLGDVIGAHNPFPYPKSLHTVTDAVLAANIGRGDYCMDFFAGSGTTGHAVIELNRADGLNRKVILVEVGEHFDTVVVPRTKKVAFSPAWKAGKPARPPTADEAERSPRIIKYIRLESYEDALDSIQFDEHAGQLKLEDRIDGYLLHYMLKWETKDSETLLNPALLASPFDYRLRVHTNGNTLHRPVDVAETFNYLLGLVVRTRRVHMDGERRYLVYRGETREAPGRTAVVIWRDTTDWDEADLKRDKAFVAERGMMDHADDVYVNGLCAIVGARPIEPLFKDRMFAGVSDHA